MNKTRLLALSLTLASCGSTIATELSLDFATFDPLVQLPAVRTELRANVSAEPAPWLVQFSRPLTADQYREFASRVSLVQGYLPDFAYLVVADATQRAALSQWSVVRWNGPFHPAYKLAHSLPQTNEDFQGTVTYFSGATELFENVAAEGLGLQMLDSNRVGDQVVTAFEGTRAQFEALAARHTVQFIEPTSHVAARNNTVRGIVQTNVVGNEPFYALGVRGEGQIVGHLDTAVRSTHVAFSDTNPIGPTHRKIVYYGTTLGASSHGTHTAGTAVGEGGAFNDLRGVAYMAKIATSPWPSFTDTASYAAFQTHHNVGARVHTNSWGNDGTTSYDGLCRGIDRFMYDNEDDLICFSVTNTSTLKNPENGKNLLAVGACQDTPNQGNHGSGGTGPTADGRRKPEIYSPGVGITSASSASDTGTANLTGTSMACPSITGAAALVRQYLMEGRLETGNVNAGAGFTPSGALLKAMLLGSTIDMTGPAGYPSNQEGWGRILLDNVLVKPGDARKTMLKDRRNAAGLTTGSQASMLVEVVSSAEPLKIVMAFTDAAATASTGAGNAAINNLDLQVTDAAGSAFLGNVFASGQSTTGGTADVKNNVEIVQRNAPTTGIYRLVVSAPAVNSGGTQGYALVAAGAVRRPFVSGSLGFVDYNGVYSGSAPPAVSIRIKEVVSGATSLVPASMQFGNFSAFLPDTLAGDYTVSVKLPHWLRKTTSARSLAAGSPALGTLTLVNGDIDDDNEIGPGDFGQLSSAFGSVDGDSNWNLNADLDGDGEVGPSDFGILSSNFGLTGDE